MKAYAALWGSLLGVFLASTLVSAAMMGLPGRRNQYLDAMTAVAVAGPATVVALLAGVTVALLPVPTRRAFAPTAETFSITLLVIVTAVALYRGAVGADDDRQLDAGAVGGWLFGAVGIMVLLTAVAIRADRRRRADRRATSTTARRSSRR